MDSELSSGHRRIRKATRLALGVCLLVLLAPPGPALAADVVVAGGVLSFSNANGELNDVTVSVAAGTTYTVDDTAGGLSAGGGCSLVNANRVTCPTAGVTAASVELGSGSDMIAVTTPVPTTISGKGGADTITTGAGTYTIDAGSGNDTVDSGAGADTITGGPGIDTVSYSSRAAAVTVSLAPPTTVRPARTTTPRRTWRTSSEARVRTSSSGAPTTTL